MRCPRCEGQIPRPGEPCDRCGLIPSVSIRPARLVDRRAELLVLVLGGLAGFGIPLLWASRALSPGEKIAWSVVALVETSLLFAGIYLVYTLATSIRL